MPKVEEVEEVDENVAVSKTKPTKSAAASFENLPWEPILLKLKPKDLAKLARVNKFMLKLVKSKDLWWKLCLRDFPVELSQQIAQNPEAMQLLSAQSVYKSFYMAKKGKAPEEGKKSRELVLDPKDSSPWVGLRLGFRMALASAIQIFPTVLMVKSLHLWTPNSMAIVGAYTGSLTLLGFFEGLSPMLFLSEEKRKEKQPNRFIDRLANLVRLGVVVGGIVGFGYLIYHTPWAWRTMTTSDKWLLGTYAAVPISLSLLGAPYEAVSAGSTIINSIIAALRIYGYV